MEEEEAVCLGCGLVVGGASGDTCHCAPRSIAPPASSASYRTPPPAVRCPRCEGRMLEGTVEDALILSCHSCGGVFLPRAIIDRLGAPGGEGLRVAFPRFPRSPEAAIRYLSCPFCATRMNRASFARSANVVVDICKEDGIWFDAGEVHAVIEFVEGGGLERARQREREERLEENAKLRAQWRTAHEESIRTSHRGRQVTLSPGERQLASTFFDWLKR